MDELTKREREVIDFIERGLLRPDYIAHAMSLKPKTIRNYLDNVCGKFGIDGKKGSRVDQLLRLLGGAKLPWQETACSDMLTAGKSLTADRSKAMAYTPHDYDVIRYDGYPDLLEVVEQPRFDEHGRFEMVTVPYGWTPKNPESLPGEEFAPEIIITDLSTASLVKRLGPPQRRAAV